MEIVLFIFYLLVFCYVIAIIPFFKKSGIGKLLLITLFLIKVAAGFAYSKFFLLPQYYSGSDTWRFYRQSLDETKWLLSSPWGFVKDLFVHGYDESGNLFSGVNSYWNDLKSNMVVKIMAVINVFTNNSYYVNILFFNFFFLFGLVALFRLLHHLFPGRKFTIIAGIFLLPSTLFWCSGIHKDGLILSATGIVVYAFHKMLSGKISVKILVAVLLSLFLVFSLRNYVLFALLPAAVAWALSSKFRGKKVLIFAAVYTTGIALFFLIPLLIPSLNFPSFIAQKQHEFLLLEGGSKVEVEQLEPSFQSFISFLPNAIDMAFFRPHYNEIKNFSYIPAFAEIIILMLLLVYCSITINKKSKVGAEVLFFLFFSVSILLIAGYTIPFTSAVVRYRSFAWPFLITPLLCLAFNRRGDKSVFTHAH